MAYPTRWQSAILDTLKVDGRATITALARRLKISDETVRRHVKALVAEGTLQRVHGAVILTSAALEPPFSRRMLERVEAKRAIAAAVAEQVSDGMTLLIDTGSTTAYVAHALLGKRDLTVVTNSLDIARTLVGRCNHTVYMAGGPVRADIGASVGPEARQLIEQFRADIAILSIGAINAGSGFMDFDVDEARIAQAMIERAERVLVAADAHKYTAKAPVRVCSFDGAGLLITDKAPPADIAKCLRSAGTAITVAMPAVSRNSGAIAIPIRKHIEKAMRDRGRPKIRQSTSRKTN